MTRTRNLSLIKRFSLVFAIAALAVPASASAHRDGGGFTQQASPAFVPAIPAPHGNVGPGTTGLGPVAPKVSGSGRSAASTEARYKASAERESRNVVPEITCQSIA